MALNSVLDLRIIKSKTLSKTMYIKNKRNRTAIVFAVVMFAIVGGILLLSSQSGVINTSNNASSQRLVTATEAKATHTLSTVTGGSTPTNTLPPTVESTSTQSQRTTIRPQTSTYTPTSGPYANKKYGPFISAVVGETEVDAEIPVRLRGWRVIEEKTLIIVMNLTARSENDLRRAKEVNALVANGYVQAVAHYDNGKLDGKIPTRLVIAEVNNTNDPPKTLYVNTSLAREYYSGQLSAPEFTDRYWNTTKNMTKSQIEYAHEMDIEAGNVTLYNETAD